MAGRKERKQTFYPKTSDAAQLPHSLFDDTRDFGLLPDGAQPKRKPGNQPPKRPKPVLRAQTPTQKRYIRKLAKHHHDILFATGPAGTGKTYVGVLWMIIEFMEGRCEKMVLARPNVGAGDDLGFLPGNLIEKMSPWMIPILDIFKEFYEPHEVERMIRSEIIEVASMVHMRGRTLKNAIIIVDEAQNCTPEQLKMLLTRFGEGSRMIITGDVEQHDRGNAVSGLADFIAKLTRWQAIRQAEADLVADSDDDDDGFDADGVFEHSAPEARLHDRVGLIKFGRSDVVRHPVIEDILAIYDL